MRRIGENYRVFDVKAMHWTNLLNTIPHFSSERGVLYLRYHSSEITQAFHSLQGIRPDLTGPFSNPMTVIQQLQQREDVDAVFMVEEGLIVYLLAKIQAAFKPDMDILQYLELAQVSLKEELGRRFHVWPQEFWGKSTLALFERVQTLLDVLPPNMVFVLGIFEETQIWASLIFLRVDGQIRLITSTKILEPFEFNIKEWQTDYRNLLKAVKDKLAEPTLGFFTDDETFRFLLRSDTPLAFISQARKAGQIIIDPIPSRIRSRI
ncbi:MAG: hypothetical protein ACFFDJ_06445 [Candidatus Odinarchaeota archaeon]